MKQTAVDWFLDEILKCGYIKKLPIIEFQQAKEMEKEQMIDAWSNGWLNDYQSDEDVKNSAEQYYNETFNTNEK